jgi:hypothetical protein
MVEPLLPSSSLHLGLEKKCMFQAFKPEAFFLHPDALFFRLGDDGQSISGWRL